MEILFEKRNFSEVLKKDCNGKHDSNPATKNQQILRRLVERHNEWKNATDNQLRNYFYEYDALNRLKSATSKTGLTTGGYNENGITYDKNGNILTLNRTGINPLSNLTHRHRQLNL